MKVSGDLDYGGVRIFQYIKNRIFPKLKPHKMDVETFDSYLSFGEALEEGIINKLRKCEEPLLTDVINRMINTKYSIEQEAFL